MRRAAVEAALAQAGLEGMYARDPAAAVRRATRPRGFDARLLAEPLALLLDEPFSKLDAELRGEMRRFLFGHVKARGITLMVTHDPEDAAQRRAAWWWHCELSHGAGRWGFTPQTPWDI